jgi:choline kinase
VCVHDYQSSSDNDDFFVGQATEEEKKELSLNPPKLKRAGKSISTQAFALEADSEQMIDVSFEKRVKAAGETKVRQDKKAGDKVYLYKEMNKGVYILSTDNHWYHMSEPEDQKPFRSKVAPQKQQTENDK